MDPRFDTILKNLRRRDNIRDFLDGLEDTECWPYPDGNEAPKPATFEDWSGPIMVEVKLREDKAYELMHFYLINVSRYHPFAPFDRKSDHDAADLTDVSISLCPEEGPGAYTVEYEVVDKIERSHAPKLELQSVATLRSAFMHRYEWVVNKLHSVNSDRRDAWKRAVVGLESDDDVDDCLGHENEEDLEEEEDHDAVMNDDACRSEGGSDDDSEDTVMHEHQLDVVVAHVHKTTQVSRVCKRESFSSDVLGCAAAYGPSAMPQHSAFNAGDNANIPRTTRDAENYGYPAISSDQVIASPPLRPSVENNFLANMLARASSAEL